MTVTCPECGHGFDPEADDEDEQDREPEPVGECVDCGVLIHHGEWHMADRSDEDRIPDESIQSVKMGQPDETVRWCGPCSDRDLAEYPDDEPVAGMEVSE